MLNSGDEVTVDNSPTPAVETEVETETDMTEEVNDEDEDVGEGRPPVEKIGTSVEGTDITAHHFGDGEKEIVFIGGIHNGFAPNTVAVTDTLIKMFEDDELIAPDNVTVTVIANLNPDATEASNTLAGRLNANGVDLNRNFDCEWNEDGVWRDQKVSGGSAPFSEPETKAIRDYVNAHNIVAAVAYYAADGGVYASNCGGSLDPEIATLTGIYADASGYTANKEFDAYAIGGDMTNWLAMNDVPAISVLLSDYTSTEWSKNEKGITAVLDYYAE